MIHSLLTTAAKICVAPLIFVLGFAGYNVTTAPVITETNQVEATLGSFNPTGGGTYRLGTSIGSTDSTIKLSSFKEPVSNTPYTMTMLNTDIGYGTLDPQTTKSEFISFTGITQNADGSASLTGVIRGLSKSYPYTASSTFRLPHAGQSIFILSDAPGLFNEYVTKRNIETISGAKTFTSTTTFASSTQGISPLLDNELATKKYVDDTAIAGSPIMTDTVQGIARLSTAAASATDPIVVGDNDTRLPTQDENDALAGTSPSATNTYVTFLDTTGNGSIIRENNIKSKFGGSGSDGALNITSGTTTIDLNYQNIFVKNYTSISITGTGSLAFSNAATSGTIIVLKSQGSTTLTSISNPTIDLRNLGGLNGTSSASGTEAYGYIVSTTTGGQNPLGGAQVIGGILYAYSTSTMKYNGSTMIVPGSGGAGGNDSNNTTYKYGGLGGRGGGALYIECAGSLTFSSSTINSVGGNGTNGAGDVYGSSGGGGGGAGGMIMILYKNLISNSGTIINNGGTGGTSGISGSPSYLSSGGGGAGSLYGAGGRGSTNASYPNTAGQGYLAGGGGGGGIQSSADPGLAGGNSYYIVEDIDNL